MNTQETNKTVVRHFIEALGRGDGSRIKTLITEDIQAIQTGISRLSTTRGYVEICAAGEMLKQLTKNGIDMRILNLTAEEDRVSAEFEGHSTLVNDEKYDNQYHMLFFVRDGKIYRMKEYMCTLLVEKKLVPFLPPIA